jgi:hypothetical protein
MTDGEEKAFVRGMAAAAASMIQHAARDLGPGPERDAATALVELHATRVALRGLFERLAIPEWNDELRLADIIEKRLERYIDRKCLTCVECGALLLDGGTVVHGPGVVRVRCPRGHF